MTKKLIELRVYTLRPGTRAPFHRRFQEGDRADARTTRHRRGSCRPVASRRQQLLLVRAFESLDQREARLAAFYGSDEWLASHDSEVMAMIESYSTCVLDGGALGLGTR